MSAVATTQQHAAEWLRRALVDGEIGPGERIRQEDAARRAGVSVVPMREALRLLEAEGQVTYAPRRGYVVTELHLPDLEEIYALRALLEERGARAALPRLTVEDRDGLRAAADACAVAGASGDVSAELVANRAFHFGLLQASDQPHLLRLVGGLWDRTEAYRARYYGLPAERTAADEAHRRILEAVDAVDADRLVGELDAHRERALGTLRGLLAAG